MPVIAERMRIHLAVALLCAAIVPCYGKEPRSPEIGDDITIPEHDSCALEVIRISSPIDSELLSEKPEFHRKVELLLKNNSKDPITISGYGSDEDALIMYRFQVWDDSKKKWPPLKVSGICGTGAKSFIIAPKGRLKCTATMPVDPGGMFRFGVVSTDKAHPDGAIIYSVATKLPHGPDQPATAPESKSERNKKPTHESETRPRKSLPVQ